MNDPPLTLKERDQWIVWAMQDRDGRPTKVPISPSETILGFPTLAKANDPTTWSSYEDAKSFYELNEDSLEGLGFVFERGLVGIDLDKCINPMSGLLDPHAEDIIERMSSYTEISPSGLGVHIYIKGSLPKGGNRRGQIEMYDKNRFFTFTGQRIGEETEVMERQEALEELHKEIFPKVPKKPFESSPLNKLEDQEVVDRASNAYNRDKFIRLWHGIIDEYDDDESAADLALCAILGYWCNGDPTQVERIFNQSALAARDKWQMREGYRTMTISKALEEK